MRCLSSHTLQTGPSAIYKKGVRFSITTHKSPTTSPVLLVIGTREVAVVLARIWGPERRVGERERRMNIKIKYHKSPIVQ